MKNPKIRLYIRIRTADGRSFFADPVWNKNRTLKAGYAAPDSNHHPEGIYYLRFLLNGKRVWQAIGKQPDAAIAALRKKEVELQSASLGIPVSTLQIPVSKAESAPRTLLQDAIKVYLNDLQRFRAPGTVAGAKPMLRSFGGRFAGRFINDINRQDLLDHMDTLKGKGLSDRTIFNHVVRIGALLRSHGIVGLLSSSDKPRYEEREAEAYDSDELARLFAAANPEKRMIFEFFLGSGLREQEVMFTTWRNIDFKGKVVKVRSKPEMGFKIKDHEERSVPVPDTLISALAERKRSSSSMLVFPGIGGKPNGHFLRMIQNLAYRAGLNLRRMHHKGRNELLRRRSLRKVGTPTSFERRSRPCTANRECLRVLFKAGFGHSDLATTLRYLAAADLRSERTRNQVNKSFAALTIGAA